MILLALAILAVILAGVFYFNNKSKPGSSVTENEKKPFAVDKKDLPFGQLPSGFPQDLPVEGGSSVLQNYEATTTDGRKQFTRISTTSKQLPQAVKVYEDYFLGHDWMEIPTSQITGSYSALFRKKDDVLLVTASSGVATSTNPKKNILEISLTQAPTNNNQ